jgi:hypothetical protein
MIHRLAAELQRLSAMADCPVAENAASEDKVFLRQNMTTLTDEIARLREEKASDWKAACESTRLASTEIARLRLTAAERDVLREVCRVYADEDDVGCNEIAFVIDRILARTKSNDNTQDGAEPSPASAGSQPVAWIAVFDGHDADGEFVWPDRGRAMEWASARQGVTIAPLYLQPQPTLTDEETLAIKTAIVYLKEDPALPGIAEDKESLRGLLERLK